MEKRIVIRPKVRLVIPVMRMLLSAAAAVAAVILSVHFIAESKWKYAACGAAVLLWVILAMKHTFITLILLYQKYAPSAVRSACRFTPCCSEYTRISIEKYGAVIGLFKGIGRIIRCRPPNGGRDDP